MMSEALKLSDEALHRDLKVSHGSLIGTLGHIHFADRIWYFRTVDPTIKVYMPTDTLSPAEIDSEWSDIQRRWEEWSDGLADSDLSRVCSYKLLNGNPGETPVGQIVMHLVNHATLHRGQAMAMLRQLGVQPPPTDLIFYYREQK
jgi:uncharacterized damage-inducible protein DinB